MKWSGSSSESCGSVGASVGASIVSVIVGGGSLSMFVRSMKFVLLSHDTHMRFSNLKSAAPSGSTP